MTAKIINFFDYKTAQPSGPSFRHWQAGPTIATIVPIHNLHDRADKDRR